MTSFHFVPHDIPTSISRLIINSLLLHKKHRDVLVKTTWCFIQNNTVFFKNNTVFFQNSMVCVNLALTN